MAFHPRMQSRIEGITVVDDLRWRAWNGVITDVWTVECRPGARGEYVSQAPRLVVVLDQVGDGGIRVTASRGGCGTPASEVRGPLNYVPAGLQVWSSVEGIRRLRHLDVHFDGATLEERLGEEVDPEALGTPRLEFADERLSGLARLISAECVNPAATHDLYGESLVSALLVALLRVRPRADRRRGALPPRQLKRAIEYIEDNCTRTIRLQELAELTGLSQSYFCSAFKAATGLPPHRWQMRARVDRTKALLARPDMTLAAAAAAAGFSDQAHLTRVFRQVVGTTPAAWQRRQPA